MVIFIVAYALVIVLIRQDKAKQQQRRQSEEGERSHLADESAATTRTPPRLSLSEGPSRRRQVPTERVAPPAAPRIGDEFDELAPAFDRPSTALLMRIDQMLDSGDMQPEQATRLLSSYGYDLDELLTGGLEALEGSTGPPGPY
ncbi:hypothetical protein HYH03_014739 [Edaphochlamys debaryana]|uniref:Uncharacterized protein n=1 Tax=Edaphochlamys debaryana TaxID=47281 RepID=A0A835XN42_9CHLO|nr:hypothetical protein HYH03_014739 [Edaphochlamys debaryana]|eukprot:KAG2486569.1 hypothetical protein HYH03_014739 [Edaphochlamys debaryana]